MSRVLSAALLLVVGFAARVDGAPVIVTWDGTNTTFDAFNQFNFNNATKTFPGFSADTLVDITGDGIWHNHSFSTQTINLEVEVDGVFQTLFSFTGPSDGISHLLGTEIPTPIAFPSGTVTAIRLTSAPGSNQTFHMQQGALVQFVFDTTAPVPEPASLALWSVLALTGGVGAWRRRKAKTA